MDLIRSWNVCAVDPRRADPEYDSLQSQFMGKVGGWYGGSGTYYH